MKFTCPTCHEEYDNDRVSPGDGFTCLECGAPFTVVAMREKQANKDVAEFRLEEPKPVANAPRPDGANRHVTGRHQAVTSAAAKAPPGNAPRPLKSPHVPKAPPPAAVACPFCAEMIPVGAQRCPYCGEALAVAPNQSRATGRHAAVKGDTGRNAAVRGDTGRHRAVKGNTRRHRAVDEADDAPRPSGSSATGALIAAAVVVVALIVGGVYLYQQSVERERARQAAEAEERAREEARRAKEAAERRAREEKRQAEERRARAAEAAKRREREAKEAAEKREREKLAELRMGAARGELAALRTLATEYGDVAAQLNLGNRYARGLGVKTDRGEAEKWYKMAAARGSASAKDALATLARQAEREKQEKAEREAAELLRKAGNGDIDALRTLAEQGNAEAQWALGMHYDLGKGVAKNPRTAVAWYRKAANQGYAAAQVCLGLSYESGDGVEEDEQEAAKWFRKAAEQGDAVGQRLLGLCYYFGEGVEENEPEGIMWLKKAAAQDDEKAKEALKKIREREERQREEAEAVITVALSPSVKIQMMKIKAGHFTMGSPAGEMGRDDNDERQHGVTIPRDYWLGKYEVTQAQWQAVMGGNPSRSSQGGSCPVECVTLAEAREFCAKLNARFGDELRRDYPGYRFDLPTEEQWEYACRAGTATPLNSGENLTARNAECRNLNALGWYAKNSNGRTHSVGSKRPNAWGLYDMHGNVWEWCRNSIFRGGGWRSEARLCRAATRDKFPTMRRNEAVGFRLALVSD